ncbi:MAG: SPOR domain-containing protein, partial [Spirochaetales bacterium]|nr:SPOR domain-containing protein [Spirochaetales bacterium]
PDVPQKEKSVPDPTHETPTVDEEKDIALDTKEPPLHEDGEKTTTDAGKTYEEIVEITLEEADPHPPGTRDDREITEIVSDASHRIDETETALLVPGYYFIQLGAYAEKQLASSIQKRFTNLYPVKIYEIAHTKITIYKVLVGPLNKDESDTLLFRFKALGYRDAFVKYIN